MFFALEGLLLRVLPDEEKAARAQLEAVPLGLTYLAVGAPGVVLPLSPKVRAGR